MALFGLQLVITIVVAFFLQKLGVYYSFGRWLICKRLVMYLHPTDEHLKKFSNAPSHGSGGNRSSRRNNERSMNGQLETFSVPKRSNIQLKMSKIDPVDVIQLNYFSDYKWLMDFSVASVIVFGLGEIYFALFTTKEQYNLSIIWLVLTCVFTLKVLISLSSLYFTGGDESAGERSLCVVFGFLFLVLSMIVLIVDENFLEFGLTKAYDSFTDGTSQLLENITFVQNSSSPISEIGFKLCLASSCSFVSALLVFPCFRFARMHLDSLKYASSRPLLQLLLHLNFVSPLLVMFLWVKPVARDYIVTDHNHSMLSSGMFENIRLIAMLFSGCLRLSLILVYLQAYLNMAHDKIEDMKKETGRITNIEIQKTVARVFYYLCVVTLQYIAPSILLIMLTIMLKSLGGYSWNISSSPTDVFKYGTTNTSKTSSDTAPSSDGVMPSLSLLQNIFTPVFFRGLLTYQCWWLSITVFTMNVCGVMYYTSLAS